MLKSLGLKISTLKAISANLEISSYLTCSSSDLLPEKLRRGMVDVVFLVRLTALLVVPKLRAPDPLLGNLMNTNR